MAKIFSYIVENTALKSIENFTRDISYFVESLEVKDEDKESFAHELVNAVMPILGKVLEKTTIIKMIEQNKSETAILNTGDKD